MSAKKNLSKKIPDVNLVGFFRNNKDCAYMSYHQKILQLPNISIFSHKAGLFKPLSIYLLNVKNRNTRPRCKICSTLSIKTAERHQWCR